MTVLNETLILDDQMLKGFIEKVNDQELMIIRLWKAVDALEKQVSANNLNEMYNV